MPHGLARFDRDRHALVSPTDPEPTTSAGRSGLLSLRRYRIALAVTMLAVAGCAAGPAQSSPEAASTPSRPATAAGATNPASAAEAGKFADAPALIGTQYGRIGNPTDGPDFPLVHRADPAAAGTLIKLAGDEDQVLGLSPTGEYAAFLQEATAVEPAAVRIESIMPRNRISLAERAGQSLGGLIWSPDGRAIAYSDETGSYVHRIGGKTAVLPSIRGWRPAFTSDAEGTGVTFCGGEAKGDPILTAQVGDATSTTEELGVCDSVGQAVTATGDAVGIYVVTPSTSSAPSARVLRAAPTGPSVPVSLAGVPSGLSLRTLSSGYQEPPCGGTIIRFQRGGIYDIENGVLTPTPASETCPVPSPDHSRYAVATSDGPVVVVAAGSQEPTTVAEAGVPIAWSADGSELAVEGRGVFLVKADGSGGRPASVQVGKDAAATQSSALFCRAGDTGKAVIITDSGPVLYDVATDSATALPEAATGDTCWLTPDSRWLVTGSLVVDVEQAKGLALLTPGQQSDLSAFSDHRWVGPQLGFSAERPLR